jgi:hypothetical protein
MSEVKSITEGQEEFEEYPDMTTSVIPDFTQILKQRVATAVQPSLPGFDPHAMMVKKNQIEKGEIAPDPVPEVKWPEKDIKALEEFCKKYGIMGFNCGRMSPTAAMAMLRNMMGIDERPLEDRVPYGYQKSGTPNLHSANFPYQHPTDKRVVLNG